LNSLHLNPDKSGTFAENGIYLSVTTSQSKITIAQASCVSVTCQGQKIKPISTETKTEEKAVFREFKIKVVKNKI